MQTQEGTVMGIDRNYVSRSGKKSIFLMVGNAKYYIFDEVVPSTLALGDGVSVTYDQKDAKSFKWVKRVEITTPAPPGYKPPEVDHEGQSKLPQDAPPVPQDDRSKVFIRQTALKCASELISAKVLGTSTGAEGICALANEFVQYLTDGTMPKSVR